ALHASGDFGKGALVHRLLKKADFATRTAGLPPSGYDPASRKQDRSEPGSCELQPGRALGRDLAVPSNRDVRLLSAQLF
ncbi:hypothetical protein, partial [Mesorhizobium sp.]|uniref:hypothetical protein n=1 Tax=Mesorhizobium sp. TaxID=1871066 RepID=UPI0025ED6AFA